MEIVSAMEICWPEESGNYRSIYCSSASGIVISCLFFFPYFLIFWLHLIRSQINAGRLGEKLL